jgi:hypothetical protein
LSILNPDFLHRLFDLGGADVLWHDGGGGLPSGPQDYVVLSSGISHASLAALAAATKHALVTGTAGTGETPAAAGEALAQHFKVVLEVTSDGDGAVLAAFPTMLAMWRFLLRCQRNRTELSRLHRISIAESKAKFLSVLRDNPLPDAPALRAIPAGSPFTAAYGGPPPVNLWAYTYWAEFYRGILHLEDHDDVLTDENPYLLLQRRLVRDGHLFDQGAMHKFGEEDVLRQRVGARLRNFSTAETSPAVLLHDRADAAPAFQFADDQGRQLPGTVLDGHHRICAAYLKGKDRIDVYCFTYDGRPEF